MDVSKYIPVKNIIGHGSQIDDFAEGQLEYMNMPKSMDTFSHPLLPEPDEVAGATQGLEVLKVLSSKISYHLESKKSQVVSLQNIDSLSLDLINQVLGVGEVSIFITGTEQGKQFEIQESVMAGVWRIRLLGDDKSVLEDYIEVGLIPEVVTNTSFANAESSVDADLAMDADIINSPSILIELKERGLEYKKGDQPLVVNLTLLPLSERDVFELGARLGVGPVTILSRGYGNCRIGSTKCNNIWWIKYYNSDDSLILNTIEVTDMPEVAIASYEDLEDSLHRLDEILEIYK